MIKHVKKLIIHRALDRLLRNALCQMWGKISPSLKTALFLKIKICKDKLFPSNLTVSLKKKKTLKNIYKKEKKRKEKLPSIQQGKIHSV